MTVEKYLLPIAAVALAPVMTSVWARPNMSVPVTVKLTPLSLPVLATATRAAVVKVELPPTSVRLPSRPRRFRYALMSC